MSHLILLIISPVVGISLVNWTFSSTNAEVCKDLYVLAYAEVVQQTESVVDICILTIVPPSCNAKTYVRNEVPNALFVITAEHVREVEHNVFVYVHCSIKRMACFRIYLFSLDEVELSTKTKTWCEPFTYSYGETDSTTFVAEGVIANTVLLRSVVSSTRYTSTYEPISPKWVSSYTVLFGRNFCFLSHSRCGRCKTYKGKCNH